MAKKSTEASSGYNFNIGKFRRFDLRVEYCNGLLLTGKKLRIELKYRGNQASIGCCVLKGQEI